MVSAYVYIRMYCIYIPICMFGCNVPIPCIQFLCLLLYTVHVYSCTFVHTLLYVCISTCVVYSESTMSTPTCLPTYTSAFGCEDIPGCMHACLVCALVRAHMLLL